MLQAEPVAGPLWPAAGLLDQSQSHALIAKLQATVEQLNDGQTNEAINQLQAFVTQVNHLIASGVLPSEEGQRLIDGANKILAELLGSSH